MDEMKRLHEVLGEMIARYPRVIKGDAMCGEHGALRMMRRAVEVVINERPTPADGGGDAGVTK